MTNHQIQLVQHSFSLVASYPAEAVGDLFYSRLFIIAPDVRGLFHKTTTPEQSRKLVTMLASIVGQLAALETILDDVAKLAKRHVQYGVKEQHYTKVGEALLWTLEQGLGDAWTTDVKEAWVSCYTLLTDAMLTATRPATVV
jgi:nitric oxide dioxygenase